MTGKRRMKILKTVFITVFSLFILLNIFVAIHAYSLSHFKEGVPILTPEYKPTFTKALQITFCGLDLPRPYTTQYPAINYDSLSIPVSNSQKLDAWLLHTDSLKQGLIIGFHGYMDEKSSMLDRADKLLNMGYDVLLVNFMGAGDSYGEQTTMGYLEADNVITSYKYATEQLHEENIVLLGFSMGAAAIMRAQSEHNPQVKAIILEAPYGTFEGTVNARLKQYNIPSFPICNIFTFWFGKLNGFNVSEANPLSYGKNIYTPVLLMCGGKDQHIPIEESESIFNTLASIKKEMKIFEESAHESYLKKYPYEWNEIVQSFLIHLNKPNTHYE